jgi:hypothetical protein
MNPYLRIALMIVINLISFKLAGFWFGILATAIVIYRILNIIGILKSPSLYRGPFYEGVAFTKDYTGSYSQKEDAFKDAYNLINLFKLEDFVPIGIYFDSPGKVEESKLRCSIGIYKKNVGFPEKLPEEFERYCEQNGYNKSELPNATSIYCSWDYFNLFNLKLGIKKFHDAMKESLQSYSFKRSFNINESKLKATIHLLGKDCIEFFVPILNGDKFVVFKKDK